MPEFVHLTTGTFNQVVKDRNRIPPERREFSPEKSCVGTDDSFVLPSEARHTSSFSVLETHQPYRAAKTPVNARIPQNFHDISTVGIPDREQGSQQAI